MKSNWLQIVAIGFTACCLAAPATAQGPQPFGLLDGGGRSTRVYPASACSDCGPPVVNAAGNSSMFGGLGPALFGSACNSSCGANGCDARGYQPPNCGPGLTAGCPPVGPMGGGMGCGPGRFGCGIGGYHAQAYDRPPMLGGMPANPFEQYPGFDAGNNPINFGDVCCGPHWYDIMVQAVFLQRDNDVNVALSSDGARGVGPPAVILSTDDLDTGLNTAIRVAGRIQLSATSSMEAVYLGGLDWDDTQTRFNNFDNLFSVYSDFGANPLGGFQDTDQATTHTARLDSDLDSAELSYRRGWISPNQRTSGSWLIGGRYIRLRDNFQFATVAQPHIDPFPVPPVASPGGSSQYDVATENDMVGLQLGAEVNHCLMPGWQIGAEAKGGVYGNSVEQQSAFQATTANFQFAEGADKTEVAFSTEAQLFVLWQIHPLAKVRAGYELLFLSGVATGAGNFNTANPFLLRNAVLNDDSDLLLHGFNVGMEFGW